MRLAPIDLVERLPAAEWRTYGRDAPSVVRLGVPRVAGISKPAIVISAPVRLIYRVRLPKRAVFDADVAVLGPHEGASGATIRIGFSDQRHYDQPLTWPIDGVSPAWMPMHLDLGAYSGWEWSLFYRPSRIDWDFIVNVDARPAAEVALAGARITM
jgi:hypothetical protein